MKKIPPTIAMASSIVVIISIYICANRSDPQIQSDAPESILYSASIYTDDVPSKKTHNNSKTRSRRTSISRVRQASNPATRQIAFSQSQSPVKPILATTAAPNLQHIQITKNANQADRQDAHAISSNAYDYISDSNRKFIEKYKIDPSVLVQLISVTRAEAASTVDYMSHPEYSALSLEERVKLANDSRQRLQDSLLNTLGEENFATFLYYRETQLQRNLADLVAEECLNSGTALDESKIDGLVEIFRRNNVTYVRRRIANDSPEIRKNVIDSISNNLNAITQDAQSLLSPAEANALGNALNGILHW